MGRLSNGKLWDNRDWVDLSTLSGVVIDPADMSASSLTTGLSARWAEVMASGKSLVGPPRDCTILVAEPIIGRDFGTNDNNRFYGKPRFFAYPGTTLTIELHPTLSATAFPSASALGVAVVQVYRLTSGATVGTGESYTVEYHAYIGGIKVKLNGVPAAWGFDFGGHQHCTAEDLEVVGTGSKGGITRLYGPGAVNRNIKITGTTTPLRLTQLEGGDATVGCTIAGLDIINPEGPIIIRGNRASTNFAGMSIVTSSASAPIVVNAVSGTQTQNAFTGNLNMFRCRIEYTGTATNAVAIDNSGGNRYVGMLQCEFKNYSKIVDNTITDVAGTVGGTHWIEEYSYSPATLNGLTAQQLTDGVKATASTFAHASNGTAVSPRAGLVESMRVATPNICDESLYHWLDESWNGQPGLTPDPWPSTTDGPVRGPLVGVTDNSARINTLLTETEAARKGLYIPSGMWGQGAPITMGPNAKLVFAPGGTAVLAATAAWMAAQTTATFQISTADDTNGRAQIWRPHLATGSESSGSWIGGIQYRVGKGLLMGAMRIDQSSWVFLDRARRMLEFSGNAGGRVFGIIYHNRIAGTIAGTLPNKFSNVTMPAAFRKVYVSAGVNPLVFIGFNLETIAGGNDNFPVWSATVPPPAVEFARAKDVIVFGTKWESSAAAMIRISCQANDNLWIGMIHSWSTTSSGGHAAPLVDLVSPASATLNMLLGPRPGSGTLGTAPNQVTVTFDQTNAQFVNATGYGSGYGASNKVNRGTEYLHRVVQGTAFTAAAIPFTWPEPDLPDPDNDFDSPELSWIKVAWRGQHDSDATGIARMRILRVGDVNLATDSAALTASSGVTGAANVLDSNDATHATCVGDAALMYVFAEPERISSVVLRVGNDGPYRLLVTCGVAATGRTRTLADLTAPAWVSGQDFVIDCLAPFGRPATWNRRARALISTPFDGLISPVVNVGGGSGGSSEVSWALTAPSADLDCIGPRVEWIPGAVSLSAGQVVYLASGGWALADADTEATSAGVIGFTLTACAAGAAVTVALPGALVRYNAESSARGTLLYLSTTAGGITTTKPSGNGNVRRLFAQKVSTTTFVILEGTPITYVA